MLLVPWLQRLDAGDQDLVGHDCAGRQHLGATHRDPRRIAIDHAGRQVLVLLLARALRAIRLRVDDHIGEVEVVVAGLAIIVRQRAGPRPVIGLEDVEAHVHAGNARGHMVGRPPQEARMQAAPRLERAAPLAQRLVALGQLPDAVGAAAGLRDEAHQLRLLYREVVQPADRSHGVRKGGMGGDVADLPAVQIDGAAVAQAGDMVGSGLQHWRSTLLRQRYA